MVKLLSSSNGRLPLSLTINLAAIRDYRIGSRFVESLGGPMCVVTTILSHVIDSRLSFLKAIYFGEFLMVGFTMSEPGCLVDIVVVVV